LQLLVGEPVEAAERRGVETRDLERHGDFLLCGSADSSLPAPSRPVAPFLAQQSETRVTWLVDAAARLPSSLTESGSSGTEL
jgi:hypothetical protein